MHVSRRRFLLAIQADVHWSGWQKSQTTKWAVRQGYAVKWQNGLHITEAGAAALAYALVDPDERLALQMLPKLRGKTLCRQSSNLPEAQVQGGGFLYFTEPDHKVFPTIQARILIDGGYLTPHEDGLFAGISQTFEVAEHA